MSKKRVPYISIDGIPNAIADAALLSMLSLESFQTILQGEKLLMAKAKLNLVKLRKRQYEKKDLISSIAPLLQKEYSIYNTIARPAMFAEHEMIDRSKLDESSDEEWIMSLQEGTEKDPSVILAIFNEIRFHHDETLHRLAKPLLEHYADLFEDYTGLDLGPGFERKDMDMRKQKETMENMEDSIGGKFKKVQELLVEIEENTKFFDHDEIAKLRTGLEEAVAKIEKLEKEQGELQKELQSKEAKLKKTETSLEKMRLELKAKESSLSNATKLNKELEKANKTLEAQNEKHKKDAGKTALAVGELRKKAEELEKKNEQYSKKIKVLEENKETALESLKTSIESQMRSQMALTTDDFEAKIFKLESELDRKERTLQETMVLNQNLQEKIVMLEKRQNDLEAKEKNATLLPETSAAMSDPSIAALVRELVRQEMQSSHTLPVQEKDEAVLSAVEEREEEDGFSFLKDLIDIKPV